MALVVVTSMTATPEMTGGILSMVVNVSSPDVVELPRASVDITR